MRARVGALVLGVFLAACGAAAPVHTEEPTAEEEDAAHPYVVALRLEEAAETEDGTPETRVSLVRITPEGDRTIETLRTEPGACFLEPAAGALIGARCWWAGQGAVYRVRREGDAIIALRADADEESGAGEPVELARLEVPEGAALRVLSASAH